LTSINLLFYKITDDATAFYKKFEPHRYIENIGFEVVSVFECSILSNIKSKSIYIFLFLLILLFFQIDQ